MKRFVVLCGYWLLLALCAGPARAQIRVGPSARVSASIPHAAQTEAFIVAHPTDANRVAACTMVVDPTRNRLSSALYLSENRGATWRLAVHDTVSRMGESWDPACAFAPDGVVLFATLPDQRDPMLPPLPTMTRVYRSSDNGRTWDPPREAPFLDNEDIAVDWTGGSGRGHIYMVGVRTRRTVPGRRFISLIHSADGGRSFQGPVDRLPEPGTLQGTVGAPVIGGDGSLLVPIVLRRDPAPQTPVDTTRIPENAVALVRVTAGGTSFDPPMTVAPIKSCPKDGGPPVVAIDRTTGPFANRMYVVFSDATHGRCQIKLAWSDNGTQWSKPVSVDDPPVPLEPNEGPDAFFPQVAVNKDGIVGISWYDRREDGRNRDFRQRFTASADGGTSVLRSVTASQYAYHYPPTGEREPLTTLSIRFTDTSGGTWIAAATGRAHRVYYEIGDYGGMAVRADGAFLPIWIDNRHGVEQLFTAPIEVAVQAKRPEERDQALGRDVSRSTFITVTRTLFDAATCTVEFGLELSNASDRPLALPLTARVDTMLSQLGVPVPLGIPTDDIGRPLLHIGATGQLPPKGTVSHSARFKLEECRPLAGRGEFTYRHQLDARLQATPTAGIAGPKVLAMKLRVFQRP